MSLQFAAACCQSDREIVRTAVQRSGRALRYASQRLRISATTPACQAGLMSHEREEVCYKRTAKELR
eukprot:5832811-Amphidinium_carterae.1